MNDYTQAPACAMLAVYCACCGKPLLDATSVETGMGPECRRKHGYNAEAAEGDRAEANRIVRAIACEQTGAAVAIGCARLAELGFGKLAERIGKRIGCIRIEAEDEGDFLIVKAPYNEAHVAAMRAVPGRRWDREAKADRVPASSRAALWGALRAVWPGRVGIGPAGMFVIA